MIFTNLAPNVSFRDLGIVSSFFLLPWKWGAWMNGGAQIKVRKWFTQYLNTDNVYLLDSGRSALYVALRALGIEENDEVIVPGYTCIVVTNAIRAVGATPVLVDIQPDGNMDPTRVVDAITEKTVALLAQHTFGLPCDLGKLRTLCDTHDLYLIEDCAHALGAHTGGKPVGSYGDVAFFSFGSDKVVSSVRGGALVVHNDEFATPVADVMKDVSPMPRRQLWQHICYISAFAKLKPFYRYGGKALLYLFRKASITAVITEKTEREGNITSWSPTQYPNILAAVVLPQLYRLYKMKMKRRIIAGYYQKHLLPAVLLPDYAETSERTYLHFPIQIDRVEEYRAFMKKLGIQVGTDWSSTPIAPATATQIDAQQVDIPTAEALSKKLVQLPIHQKMTIRKAKQVVSHTNKYLNR